MNFLNFTNWQIDWRDTNNIFLVYVVVSSIILVDELLVDLIVDTVVASVFEETVHFMSYAIPLVTSARKVSELMSMVNDRVLLYIAASSKVLPSVETSKINGTNKLPRLFIVQVAVRLVAPGKVSLNEHFLRIMEEHEKSFESPKMKGLKRRTENSVKCMIEFFPRLLMKN
ncbi:UNVERIFIED_CONTAM: hypothetical protein RMT77_019904 [Armadillidium vulgare]